MQRPCRHSRTSTRDAAVVRYNTDGTLGALMRRRADPSKLYLLSAYHVLDAGKGNGEVKFKKPNGRFTTIATYTRSEDTCFADFDVAIAEVDTDLEDFEFTNKVLGTELTLRGRITPVDDMELQKSGATTGLTRCRFEKSLESFGSVSKAYMLQVAEGAATHFQFCAQGDSGAVWWAPNPRSARHASAVALHSKGDLSGVLNGVNYENRGCGVSMHRIMQKLRLRLAQGTIRAAATA